MQIKYFAAISLWLLSATSISLACTRIAGSTERFEEAAANELKVYLILTSATVALTLIIYFIFVQKGFISAVLSLLCFIFHPGWYTNAENIHQSSNCEYPVIEAAQFLLLNTGSLLAYQAASLVSKIKFST